MDRLASVTVYLSPEALGAVHEVLEGNGWFDLQAYHGETSGGEAFQAWEVDLFGVTMRWLPCDEHHDHRDLEIGLTSRSAAAWSTWLAGIEAAGVPVETGPLADDSGAQFASVGPDSVLGPFFFVYDGFRSDPTRLRSLEAEVDGPALHFFDQVLRPALDPTLAGRFRLVPSPDEAFRLNTLRFAVNPGDSLEVRSEGPVRLSREGSDWVLRVTG